jgi:TPR repeat protein
MLCKGRGVTQNHREAFNCFLAAAEQNYLDAYHQVALYYYKGSPGVTHNLEKADRYFKKAAELGKRDSMAGYAQTCQDKIRLIRNTVTLTNPLTPEQQKEITRLQSTYIYWYKEAAKLNHTASLREVGKLYDSGLGVKQDYARANSFFQKASDQGDPLATLLLGSNYENGSGIPVDNEKAIRLYHKALEYGQPT